MGTFIGHRATQAARLLNRVGLGGMNQVLKRVLGMVMHDTLKIHVDGLVIQGPAVSWRILNNLSEGEYESVEVRLFKECLTPGMVVLDIGANVGYYALVAARIVGPTGHVFAFEPDPRTRDALVANMARNNFKNVTVIGKGASDAEGEHEMYLSASANRSSLYQTPSLERVVGKLSVEQTTVDAELNGRVADVAKMDIEGAEAAAYRGMRKSLRPGAVLFMEFSPPMLAAAGADPDEFGRLLIEEWEAVEMIHEGGLISIVDPPTQFTNLRCSGWRGG